MSSILEGLNDAQTSAVTSPASVLQVLAPPGSGKTKTLTARVAYLINHERLQPWNIIVCTFTIKAAKEMKERIRGFVGQGIEQKLILGTFHSVARRFLVRYGQEIGIPKNFGIADTGDSKGIIKRIIERQQYLVTPDQARSRISGLKARNISAEQFAGSQKKADENEFACIYAEYEEHLKAQNLLDYDDLLVRCVQLLQKHPRCVSAIQAVLIDEYQDTNNVQYELMRLLAQQCRRITIVGDPDQSIYSFRAADQKNLMKMRTDYPDAAVINLEMNYRSSGCILSSAMAIIEQDESRIEKSLIATHIVGEQPTLRHLATAQVEAWWVVDEIQRTTTLTAGLLSYNDYAILIRSAALSLSLERSLSKAGIPYRMVGGLRFFDRAEIKILLDYLRVINQPDSNDALTRVINLPSRKIGESTVKALLQEAEENKTTLWGIVLGMAQGKSRPRCKISKPAQLGIDLFVNIILTGQKKLTQECDLLSVISHVIQKINFEAYLKNTHKDNWKERWANVEELVNQATQMATSVANGEEVADDALPKVEGLEQRQDTAADVLSKFLANITLSSAVEQPGGEEVEQVTISTIHAAKGLEWPVVFIPAVYMGSIPHSRAEDHDEERRLLYVGMTRAQGLLYLSCPVKLTSSEETVVSKYINERSIQKFFSRCGPSIGYAAIRDLAQILRRPCPVALDVQTAQNSIERLEDDKYPLTRDEIDGEEPIWDKKDNDREPSFKRPKLTHSSSDMGSNKRQIAEVPAGTGGFTSANNIRAKQEEAERTRMLSWGSAASNQPLYNNAPQPRETNKSTTNKPTTKVKPRAAGQGAITGFFKRTASSLSDEQPLPPQTTTTKQPTLSPYSLALPPSRPLSDISNRENTTTMSQLSRHNHKPYQPPSFPTHNLRNTRMPSKPQRRTAFFDDDDENANATKNARRHVLLSSSPTKVDHEPVLIATAANDDARKPTTTTTTTATATSAFRPASTLHATSMGQLQAQAQGQTGQRKTLGARRSMQGWSVKHSAPPRPRGM